MASNAIRYRVRPVFPDPARIAVPPGRNRWTGEAHDESLRHSVGHLGPYGPIGVLSTGEDSYLLAWGSRVLEAWKTAKGLGDRPIPAVLIEAVRVTPGPIRPMAYYESAAPDDEEVLSAAEVPLDQLDEPALLKSLAPLDKARVARACLAVSQDPRRLKTALAQALGVTRDRLNNLLRVLASEELTKRVEGGTLTLGAAVALAGSDEEGLKHAFDRLSQVRGRPRVRHAERLVAEWGGSAKVARFSVGARTGKVGPLVEALLGNLPAVEIPVEAEWSRRIRKPRLVLEVPIHWTERRKHAEVLRAAEEIAGVPTTDEDSSPGPKPKPGQVSDLPDLS